MTSIFAAGTWKISWRNCEECWLITIRRSESSASSTITRSWSGFGFTQHGVQRSHDRHAETPQQFQDMATSRPTENSVFVLHAYQIDIGEIEELGCALIGRQLLFRQLEANPLGIAVFRLRIVHRQGK